MRLQPFATAQAALAAFAVLAVLASLMARQAIAPPPVPHSISGYILESDGITQVQLGISYSINETVSRDFLRGKTESPVPELSGYYFETINGSDGDAVIIMAWNSTHYGNTTVTLNGDMESVNITLNTTRSPEMNVTITYPADNAAFNASASFNLTANISVIGAGGAGCNATTSLSDTAVLNISGPDSLNHSLGSMQRDSFQATAWNISAQGAVNATATVLAACEQQGVNLEGLDTATVYNITVLDNQTPEVSLISPANNSLVQMNSVTFSYNVTENSRILNCSLLINNLVNATNSSAVEKGKTQNITQYLANSNYNWTISCFDFAGNAGNGTNFNLTVNLTAPFLYDMMLTSPVNLVAGSNATVWCNATVSRQSGIEVNISRVNATFFDSTAATSTSPDDNNDHYTNASCANLTLSGDAADYGCAFSVWYYANNASWMCNMIAADTSNQTGFSAITTTINELVALSAGGLLEFGALAPTNISNDTNLTLSNQGNTDINVSVRGYGTLPAGDNLSLVCGEGGNDGNVSVTSLRYGTGFNTAYEQMANLTNQSALVSNFTLFQKTNDAQNGSEFNQTYWKIQLPTGIGGNCTGAIVIMASLA